MKLFQYKVSLDNYLQFQKMVTLRLPDISNEFSYKYLRSFLMSEGSDALLGRKVIYDVERSVLVSCLDISRLLYDVCPSFRDEDIGCVYMNTFYYYIGSNSHWSGILDILKREAGVFTEGSDEGTLFISDKDGMSKVAGYRLPSNSRVLMLTRSVSSILDIRVGRNDMFYMLGL